MWDKIIVYRVDDKSKSVQLSRALHGYKDRSNHGRYTYKRKGLLDKIPNQQIISGVLLIKEQDTHKITHLLKKYQAKYYTATLDPKPKQPHN